MNIRPVTSSSSVRHAGHRSGLFSGVWPPVTETQATVRRHRRLAACFVVLTASIILLATASVWGSVIPFTLLMVARLIGLVFFMAATTGAVAAGLTPDLITEDSVREDA